MSYKISKVPKCIRPWFSCSRNGHLLCNMVRQKNNQTEAYSKLLNSLKLVDTKNEKIITARESGSFVDSFKSATRILVGSALAPAPVADRTFRPLRTHAARSATYYIKQINKLKIETSLLS